MKTGYYVKSIDGLRAFAVLAVILYHLGFPWMVGGYLGVTVFFVISGYLITNVFMKEYQKTNKIDLLSFWIRRARRLLPALFTMLLSVTSYISIFRPELMNRLTGDFWAAFFYVSNWWYIFEEQSYFETFQSQNVLTHLWSLAIEEQFYLIWPVILGLILYRKIDKKKFGMIVIGLGLVSAIWMSFLYQPNVDPSRVYYGTDTRVFSLLFGAALAIFCSVERKYVRNISNRTKGIPLPLCLLAPILLLVFCVCLSEFNPFVYYGGMFCVSVLTVILLYTLLHSSNTIRKVFEWKPLVWIGRRSYSLYLWHFPIIVLTTPTVYTGETQWVLILFQVALTFVLTEITYRLIENPIRYGYFFRTIKGKIRYAGIVCTPIIAGMFGLSVYGMLHSSANMIHPTNASVANEEVSHTPSPPAKPSLMEKDEPVQSKDSHTPSKQSEEQIGETVHTEKPGTAPEKPVVNRLDFTKKQVTFIGDSIIFDVIPYIEEKFPKNYVDAEVGRQMWSLNGVIQNLKEQKQLGDVLVLALGTNGAFRVDQLQAVVDELKEVEQIVLVNTRVPRKWQNHVNRALKQIHKNNPEIILADWYTQSANHDDYFVSDGVHLTKKGAKVYADMIYDYLAVK